MIVAAQPGTGPNRLGGGHHERVPVSLFATFQRGESPSQRSVHVSVRSGRDRSQSVRSGQWPECDSAIKWSGSVRSGLYAFLPGVTIGGDPANAAREEALERTCLSEALMGVLRLYFPPRWSLSLGR
jgi:hypothetical protein